MAGHKFLDAGGQKGAAAENWNIYGTALVIRFPNAKHLLSWDQLTPNSC